MLGAGSICGVDTFRFRPDALARSQVRAELGIPDRDIVCIFLGRLATDKGVLDLAKAFALSAATRSDLWLLFAGPDEDQLELRLRQLVPEKLKDKLLILGFTRNPERLLSASDFLCLPSYREGFGMVILEAAAVGIPAIGARIYGITDAIDDGFSGRLVNVGDIDELSKAISRWCEYPEERKQFGNAARERMISKFEYRDVVDGYVRYFRGFFG